MINISLCTMLHIEILYLIESYEELFDKFSDNFLKKIIKISVLNSGVKRKKKLKVFSEFIV